MQHKAGVPEEKKTGTAAAGVPGSGKTASGSMLPGASSAPPLIKTGTILFAVLDTGVNSDYPDTPVLATIISGDYKGAKLLGKVQVGQGPSLDKVSLKFNLMDMQNWPVTKTVNAFAIDPDTARTVMASNVDHHYMERYGAVMATSFLSGYASAITQAGSTATTGVFGTTTTFPPLSPASKLAVGIGKIGTTLNDQMAKNINIPLTVTVNAGVGLGILFMSDVTQ
jgi:intracellular multiplication protein IcmE